MSLTAVQVKEAKPLDKDQKLSDGEGMYLLVKVNGKKYWRMDYRFSGKRKTYALGVFPIVSLKEAREGRYEARRLLSEGLDPDAIERQLAHQARNGVRAAYTHHARYIDERIKMMQWWADYLDRFCD